MSSSRDDMVKMSRLRGHLLQNVMQKLESFQITCPRQSKNVAKCPAIVEKPLDHNHTCCKLSKRILMISTNTMSMSIVPVSCDINT